LGKVTTSIEIEASPEKVFGFVISEKMHDIAKEFVEGKWTSVGPIGVGSTVHYIGVHKYNKGEEWNGEVTEFVKNKKLTIYLTGANKRSHDQINSYIFEPTTKGTKLTMSMEVKMPYSIFGELFFALLVKRMVKKEYFDKIAGTLKSLET